MKLPRIRGRAPRGWPRLALPSTVRARIIGGFGLLVILLVLVVAASAWLARQHRSDLAEMEQRSATASLVQEIELKGEAFVPLLQLYVATGDESVVPQLTSQGLSLAASLEEARAQMEGLGQETNAERMDELITRSVPLLSQTAMKVITLRQSGDVEGARAALDEGLLQVDQLHAEFGDLSEAEREAAAALRSRADNTADLAFWLLATSGVMGAFLGLTASTLIARSILKPLSSLESSALAVAGGNLKARARATGLRELARLGASFNQMTESLVTDITERKRAEEALRESEERFRSLFESAFDGIAIHERGVFVDVNPAFAKMFGYSESEMKGMSVLDLVAEEHHDSVMQKIASGVQATYDMAMVKKDGTIIYVEAVAKEGRYEGCPVRVVAARDITERKRAEEALRESEQRFRTLAETATAAIFIYRGTKISYANPAAEAMCGYTREEWAAMDFWDVVHPDHRELIRERGLTRQHGEEVPARYEVKILTKKGQERWLDFTAASIEFEGKPAMLGTAFDITERKRAEEALRESEERYRDLFENTSDLIQSVAMDGSFLYVNRAWRETLGYSEEETLSLNMFDIIHPDSRDHCITMFQRVTAGESLNRVEAEFVTKQGRSIWVEGSAFARFQDGKPVATRGIFRDVTEHKQAEETVRHLAYHDALTDLPNRALFRDRLNLAIAQAKRSKQMVAVMLLDLDRFKMINDTAGHKQGDRLLQTVGNQLKGLVREGDTVARAGGDEFILLLPAVTGVEHAASIADRIVQSFRGVRIVAGHEFHITTSIGITIFPTDGDDAETLLRNADIAMYRAKEEGRDNSQIYSADMKAKIAERVVLESDLRHALEREEFIVYYQPQVDIRTGQIVGVEALVRWDHPDRGLVSPIEFIPVAEETGLIVELGEWVLRTACAQNKAWQEAGIPGMRIAVNVSSHQFQRRDLVQTVMQVLNETDLDPSSLEVEITESTAIQDVDHTIAVLRSLRDMGVRVAIDDFGVGHSALSYLKRFPVDVVKIDQSFVRDITIDPDDAAIVTTIITIAHDLKLSVIAEGVETEEQLAFLEKRGCDEMQGFLFSKPLPPAHLEKLLKRGKRLTVATLALGEL